LIKENVQRHIQLRMSFKKGTESEIETLSLIEQKKFNLNISQ